MSTQADVPPPAEVDADTSATYDEEKAEESYTTIFQDFGNNLNSLLAQLNESFIGLEGNASQLQVGLDAGIADAIAENAALLEEKDRIQGRFSEIRNFFDSLGTQAAQ